MGNEFEILDGPPVLQKKEWRKRLDSLEVDQRIEDKCGKLNKELRYVRSIISNYFHADPENEKVFKTTTDNQPKGWFVVWREK